MNREIRFRGFNEKHNEWRYGYYFVNRGEHFIVADNVETNPLLTEEDFNVNHETIGQYTGLKDCKGREIYEGDILRLRVPDGTIRHFVVEWVEEDRIIRPLFDFVPDGNPIRISGWCFNWNGYCLYPSVIDGVPDNERMEIVGNIHDNPELIK
jgi:uncharacterized phage protein (TIGR01671 family)|nr:MAG TPA: YopX protein [Caudoviricetes sp.]